MVTLVGSQIWWTWETEDVFRRVRDGKKHAMKDFAAKLTGQLSELIAMVSEPLCAAKVAWHLSISHPLSFWHAIITSSDL